MDGLELFITGRIKEIMIIWGRNQYPQQIEATVQASHPALRLNAGAAFSLEIDGEEKCWWCRKLNALAARILILRK